MIIILIEIEVYEFPEDCVLSELKDFFLDAPYEACCLSAVEEWNAGVRSFILEFAANGTVVYRFINALYDFTFSTNNHEHRSKQM